jgi:hypothetical protein
MKALSTLAIFLGHFGTTMANDIGPDPHVTVPSKVRTMWIAEEAFAKHWAQHHVVTHTDKP